MKPAKLTEPILQQIHREKRRIQLYSLALFPATTMFIALIFAWMFYCLRLPGSSAGDDANADVYETLFYGFYVWIAELPRIFGDDFRPGSLLFALAAVSIAIFLTLSTANQPPEQQDTVSGRANRMVLDDFSVLVATVCAVLAWMTIMTIDRSNPQSVLEFVAAVATAWLCSATVPLHIVRADVHRFTVAEAQNNRRLFSARQERLHRRGSALAHLSRRRELLSYSVWIALSAGASTLVLVGYTHAAEYSFAGQMIVVYITAFIITAAWGWFTNELFMGCTLDWMQKRRVFSIFMAVLYSFCAFMFVVLVYIVLYTFWPSWIAGVVSAVMIAVPVCAALLDWKLNHLGLLAGVKARRTRNRIVRLESTIEYAKSQLAIKTAGATRRKTSRSRYS